MPGMSREQWQGMRPVLTRGNEDILRVWEFCGNTWAPELLGLACAYCDVPAGESLIDGLLALRNFAAKRSAADPELI